MNVDRCSPGRRSRHAHPAPSWHRHLDKVVARIADETVYLRRAVDHEGEIPDVLLQRRRGKAAALKLMRKLLKRQAFWPRPARTVEAAGEHDRDEPPRAGGSTPAAAQAATPAKR